MKDLTTMEEVDLSMSNFDHTIDEGLEELLREGEAKRFAQYSGWNFCGYVWFEQEQFICQVWQYNVPQEEVKADSLEEIMETVSNDWGNE